jgi:putative chitobiose transport system substrate-binding protein
MASIQSRRRFLELLGGGSAAALLAAGLGSCGQSGPGANSAATKVLNFWTLDLAPKFNGYLGALIAAWEGENPGLRVRWTDVPWSSVERKLLAAVFARTALTW